MNVNRIRLCVCSALALRAMAAAAATNSTDPPPRDAVPRIERIALFKNGLGYATAGASLPDKTKSVRLGQLPVPSYGTFWVSYPKELKVRSLVTSMEAIEELTTAPTVDQLLRLNPGCKVSLHTTGAPAGQQSVIEGVLQPVITLPPVEPASPYFMDARRPPDRPQNTLVLVKTERGLVALSPGSIQRVDFTGGEPACVTTNQQKRPSIRMELEEPAGGEHIVVNYLARGITWVPGYRIDLSDEKTARFSAQAQIINELADLDDARVELVTGFPNVQFAELPNPAAMSQNLAEFLRSLAAGGAQGGGGGPMMAQQALVLNNFASYQPTLLPSYAISANGQTAEDLFLYPLPHVSLKRGETATIRLMSADMPYRHVYTWKIPDQLEGDRSRQLGDGRSAEEVWHTCRLVNAAGMPLTTAVAQFVKDGQFVGQDTCFYTAPGSEASIRINRAMNVQAEQDELEVERKRNAANFDGYGYDLVKLRGELKIRNRLDKAIQLEITKELSGEVLEASEAPRDVPTARGLKQVNPKHVLTWLLELKPGDEHKLTYSYQLYIRP
jgi:hypothetical protein